MSSVAAIRMKVIRQILGRGLVALAVLGVWSLFGHPATWLLAGCFYAGVTIAHGMFLIVTIGGAKLPMAVGKSERAPVGFCAAQAESSSARNRAAQAME
jgi:NAD/NADP transhydrogenase beta subunit